MKKRLARIIAGAALLAAAVFLPDEPELLKLAVFLTAYAVVGYKVVWKAVRGLFRGRMLDENFLMSIASAGAFLIGEYPEAVAVMLFYQIGELFEERAVGKSRRSIAQLMDIKPDVANLRTADGIKEVKPDEVEPGDTIIVRPGEKIPLDGIIKEGRSSLNTAALTGESLPRDVEEGDEVLSGCVNMRGIITVEVTKPFGESTVSRILDLVENAASKKSKTENFISRFAAVYTPLVVGAAVLMAILPPLLADGIVWSEWIKRPLNFLVVSCPCALVISVPLSFFGGIGGASKAGVLVKGSNYLEAMSRAEYAVMDKTGTLTEGRFHVEKIIAEKGFEKEEILGYAAMAENYSNHPISLSLRKAYGEETEARFVSGTSEPLDASDAPDVSGASEIAGKGVVAVVKGHRIAAGNEKLMADETGAKGDFEEYKGGTKVMVAVDGVYGGCIFLADKIKADSAEAVSRLKAAGVKTVMLTGDSKEIGESVAAELGIDKVYAGLLPADKVRIVEELIESKSRKGKLVFVGDGINDAPVLARADVGVAMGAFGSDAAIEAADMVIMNDSPSKLSQMIGISKKTMAIVKENIAFALGVKAAVLVLSAFGLVGMWAAVFADVGVSVIAIINALRCLGADEEKNS